MSFKSRLGALKSRLPGSASLLLAVGLFSPAAHAEISYQQILNAPDDLELNLAYARQEVATGRLQQAAAALERLLLQQPNWDTVRLFYGIVLYRLDDLDGAKRELSVLEGRNLSPEQEADRAKYLALASKGNKSVRFTGRITLGGRYDSNPGRVSDSIAGTNVTNSGEDGALTAASWLRFEADLGNGRGDYFFAHADGRLRDYFNIGRADGAYARIRAGVKFHGLHGNFTPYASFANSWLQDESFKSGAGGGFKATWTLTSQVALLVNGEAMQENYETTSYSTIGSQRDGWRRRGAVYLRWRPSDSLKITAGGRWTNKDARNNGFSYDAGRISIRAQQLFGKGRYLTLGASAGRRDFKQPDGFYSNTITRKDDLYRLRAATGAPLSSIFTGFDLPEGVGDIVTQIGITYDNQNSSINQLNIDNLSGDLIFTKRFAF